MKLSRRLVAWVLLACLCLPAWAFAETASGRTSFGIRFGDRLAEGYLDLILPLAGGGNDLLFFNPRFGLGDEGANELNLGFGYRHAIGESRLVGGNFYFDSRRTQHDNRFSQLGVGLEYLSTWVDVRGNYYWPIDEKQLADVEIEEGVEVTVTEKTSETYGWGDPYAVGSEIRQDVNVRIDTSFETTTTTTKKTFEDWESARQGFDAEIGLLVPLFGAPAASPTPALRVFGGYYHFEDDFGAELAGPKGRIELRALPFLTFDVEVYQDKNLYGSRTIAGARLHTPFDFTALLHGKNPFPPPPTKTGAAARMNEMVMRDVRVQTDTSGLAENKDLRQVTEETTIERTKEYVHQQYVLLDDVVFVDGENGTDPGQTGTAEHPYSEIQQGANNVFGLKNLYVFATPGNYVENVVLQEGTTMIGQGTAVVGMGGKAFGGDAYPVITTSASVVAEPKAAVVEFLTPVVTLASDTTVTGFTIDQSFFGIYGSGVSGDITVTNNNLVNTGIAGIVVATSGDATVNIAGNYVDGSMIGIGLLNLGGHLTAQASDNEVGNALIGIGAANLGGVLPELPPLFSDLNPFAPLATFDTAAAADLVPATTDLTAARNLVVGSEVGIGVANVGAGTMNATLDGNEVYETSVGIIGLNIDASVIGPLFAPIEGPLPLPAGALTLSTTDNRIIVNSSGYGLLGIGVVNAGQGTTVASIGGVGAGNLVDGFLLGIGAGNASGFGSADTMAAEPPPAPSPTLSASIIGNTVLGAGEVGIGVGTLGNPLTAVLIDGNTVEASGFGVGIGTEDTFFLGDTLGLDAYAAPYEGPALDVMVSNNRIVSEFDAGVGIFASGYADVSVTLSGNDISGELGVYGWTEDSARLRLNLAGGNTIRARGPGILVSASNFSDIDFSATGNSVSSSLAEGFAFQTHQYTSSVTGLVANNRIAAASSSAEILALNFGGTIQLTATDNVGADDAFAIKLAFGTPLDIWAMISLLNAGNVDSNGGSATVLLPF